ncbi:MAG: arsenic efflux protein [Bacilli bacterium]|nr:arsenic efflux protein [Bacilli bacterium]
MLDCILDGLMDTIKIIPYLFVTFLLLEFIEHKMSHKNQDLLLKHQKFGPIVGGILGALPQCGFSSMAANLFSSRVITMGTLIAVFLSTSDEMLPIMLSEKADFNILLCIIGFKVIVGIIIGFLIDLFYRQKQEKNHEHIHEMCDEDHCSCDHDGLFLSSLKHTLKIGFFILVANLAINLIIFFIGEETLSNLLLKKNIFTYFVASLIGLIPNCASSVIMTELYLSNFITVGTLIGGLLTGSGLGILLLFRTNKNMKENFSILSIIYFTGVIVGLLVDLFV